METLEYQPKEVLYEVFEVEIDDSMKSYSRRKKYKYTCRLCSRTLSSKQRVLMHLHTAHHKSEFSLSLEIGLSLPTTQILVVIFHLEISIWMAQQIDSDNL